MPRPELFLSYARASDPSFAFLERLEPALREMGAFPRRDVDITFGEQWEPTLLRWLRTCHGAVVLVTPEALQSEWCTKEVRHLLDRFERSVQSGQDRFVVVPVLLGVSWTTVLATPVFDALGAFQSLEDHGDEVERVLPSSLVRMNPLSLARTNPPGVGDRVSGELA